MRNWDSICPVCLREGVNGTEIRSSEPWGDGFNNRSHIDNAVLVDCPACGRFAVTDQDHINLKSQRLRTWEPAFRLSALLREQAIRALSTRPLPPFWLRFGMDPYGPLQRKDLTPIDLDELLGRWPSTVPDRLDRTLCNLAWCSPRAGHKLKIDPKDTTIAFAEIPDEAQFHFLSLGGRGMLRIEPDPWHTITAVSLTAEGWERFDELTHGAGEPANPVFVAMWFGVKEDAKRESIQKTEAEMTRIYKEGIEPAVKRAGYDVTRVDLEQFNDCIMDQILGDIRAAPFVVADFTGHRNGVYLEAGFARGLGHTVIQTCAESHFENAHFDIKHLNHIRWGDAGDLQEQLFQRIRGTIGQGPHPVPKDLTCDAAEDRPASG